MKKILNVMLIALMVIGLYTIAPKETNAIGNNIVETFTPSAKYDLNRLSGVTYDLSLEWYYNSGNAQYYEVYVNNVKVAQTSSTSWSGKTYSTSSGDLTLYIKIRAFNSSYGGYGPFIEGTIVVSDREEVIVTLKDYNLVTLDSRQIPKGTGIVNYPTDPYRSGYTFTHWSNAQDKYYSDTTLIAQYVSDGDPTPPPAETHSVSWYDCTGTIITTHMVKDGEDSPIPNDDTWSEGYDFLYWNGVHTNVTSSKDIFAYCDNNNPTETVQHRITFKTDTGQDIIVLDVDHGNSATPPSHPTKDGYVASGWDCTYGYTNVTRDDTCIADYDVIDTSLKTHSIVFKDYDMTTLSTQSVQEGGSATPPPTPPRDNHTFVEWDCTYGYENVSHNDTCIADYDIINIPSGIPFAPNLIDNWSITNTNGFTTGNSNLSVIDNILYITGDGTNQWTTADYYNIGNASINDMYFVYANVLNDNSDIESIKLKLFESGNSFSKVKNYVPLAKNKYNEIYDILTIDETLTSELDFSIYGQYIDGTTANGKTLQVDGKKGIYVINMTDLGIEDYTAEQMLELIHNYQLYKMQFINKDLKDIKNSNGTITKNIKTYQFKDEDFNTIWTGDDGIDRFYTNDNFLTDFDTSHWHTNYIVYGRESVSSNDGTINMLNKSFVINERIYFPVEKGTTFDNAKTQEVGNWLYYKNDNPYVEVYDYDLYTNKVTYKIDYLNDDGKTMFVDYVELGQKAERPRYNPTREGWTFKEWYIPTGVNLDSVEGDAVVIPIFVREDIEGGDYERGYTDGKKDGIREGYHPIQDLFGGVFGGIISFIFTLGTIDFFGIEILDIIGMVMGTAIIVVLYKFLRG